MLGSPEKMAAIFSHLALKKYCLATKWRLTAVLPSILPLASAMTALPNPAP
jgi:hypothetical protein